MKKLMLWIWMGMITLSVLLPSSVFAVLGEVYDNKDAEFDYSLCCGDSGDIASVHSWVEYNDPVDAYRYYYQIHDISPSYKINYFQFAIFETELGFNYGKDQPGIDPIMWSPLMTSDAPSTVYGMGAFFSTAITEGTSSYTLWFESEDRPREAEGLLSGFVINPLGLPENVALCGELFIPQVPEPATMSLLALGAGFVIGRKKNNQ